MSLLYALFMQNRKLNLTIIDLITHLKSAMYSVQLSSI